MKIFLIWLLCLPAFSEMYITVTSSGLRKARLAVGQIHALPTNKKADPALAERMNSQLRADLEFTNLFEFVSDPIFAPFDKADDVYAINYDEMTALGTAFVLRLGYKIEGTQLFVEAVFHDVMGRKKIFGTRYQFASAQYSHLIHAIVEDILLKITGERGLFSSRIAMICWERKKAAADKEVYVVNPDGSGLVKLTSDKTLSLSPSWSPDGKYLLYTQFEWLISKKIRKKGMVIKRHDLSTGERLALSRRDGVNSGAVWNPDGSRVVATLSFTGRPELYFLNPDGTGDPEPLSRVVKWAGLGGAQISSPELLFDVEAGFSPDGKKMVFSSRRTGNPMIYILDLTTMNATQLTFAGKYNATPAWSPKGDKILFAAQRAMEGNFDLFMIEPNGNNLARITSGEGAGRHTNSENPTWAPTGRHIAFANNEGGAYGVYVMTADGNSRRKISPPDKECKSPSWGPVEKR